MLGAHEWQQDITKKSSWNTDDALECLGLVDNVIIEATKQIIICYTVSKPDTVSVKWLVKNWTLKDHASRIVK